LHGKNKLKKIIIKGEIIMKKVILFFLMLYIEAFAQTISSVELNKIYCDWNGSIVFTDSVETVLRDINGNVIPPSNNYDYEYYVVTNGHLDIIGGPGINKEWEDNDGNLIQTWYVVVTDLTNNNTYQSDQVYFRMETVNNRAKPVYFSALRSDGTTESGVHKDHYMYEVGLWHYNDGSPYLTVNMDEVLKSSPFYLTSNHDKFHYWNTNQSSVLNFNDFIYTDDIAANLVANYKTSDGSVTIQNNTDGFTGDTIEFKDPWLVDFNEVPYGMRNRGNGAPLEKVLSPFNPTLSSQYHGIFFNQLISSNVYYSVRAKLIKTVNGSTAFFNDWSYSGATLQQVDPNPPGYDQKAVVFTSSGATVTANYSYSSITINTTLSAGTYNIAGNLTVQSGVTLTVNSGAVLNFPSGAGLIINGKLISSGAVFTSPNGSDWKGITLNNAEGSSIGNTTISYALSPIIINSTSSVTISQCTLNHSSFYDSNPDQAAAIQVNGSSPTISTTTIEGQVDSWNGVRFAAQSSGLLFDCTIENLGFGNGVIIQGGSHPTISDNTIYNNLYHGITVFHNGAANPQIILNNVSNSYTHNYVGIYFQYSTGTVKSNNVNHFAYGCWCRYSSSPNSGGANEMGGNIFTVNTDGIAATDNSYPDFGINGIPSKVPYYGVCNQIYSNTTYDALASGSSNLTAEVNWWGLSPPNTNKMYTDGTSYINYSNWEQSANGCPLGPSSPLYNNNGIYSNTIKNNILPDSLINQALLNKVMGNYSVAVSICKDLMKQNVPNRYKTAALVILFNIFQLSKDNNIVNDLAGYCSLSNGLGIKAKELLASALEAQGNLDRTK
jgi:parallel beta-helix repeat protein